MCSDGRVAPAVVEARLRRLALTRLMASLRVPDVDDEDGDPGEGGRSDGARHAAPMAAGPVRDEAAPGTARSHHAGGRCQCGVQQCP